MLASPPFSVAIEAVRMSTGVFRLGLLTENTAIE